jgi:hypothetical protein
MAKKQSGTVSSTIETLKPYLDRAMTDPEFRDDVKEALDAARKLYGPLAKGNGGLSGRATKLATDEKMQENLRKALEEFGNAAGTLQGKKKKKAHKARKTMLLAGVIVGALYNPWTGPQTREWLLDRVAGDSDLEPLESYESAVDSAADTVGDAARSTGSAAADAAQTAGRAATDAATTAGDKAKTAGNAVADAAEDGAEAAKRAKK